MLEKILEKVDAIKAEQADAVQAVKTSVDEVKASVETTVNEKIEALKGEFADTVTALEAKVASAKFANTVISPEKTVRGDVNKRVKEALASFYKGNSRIEKELELLLQDVRLNPTRYGNVSVLGKKNKPYVAPVNDTIKK